MMDLKHIFFTELLHSALSKGVERNAEALAWHVHALGSSLTLEKNKERKNGRKEKGRGNAGREGEKMRRKRSKRGRRGRKRKGREGGSCSPVFAYIKSNFFFALSFFNHRFKKK